MFALVPVNNPCNSLAYFIELASYLPKTHIHVTCFSARTCSGNYFSASSYFRFSTRNRGNTILKKLVHYVLASFKTSIWCLTYLNSKQQPTKQLVTLNQTGWKIYMAAIVPYDLIPSPLASRYRKNRNVEWTCEIGERSYFITPQYEEKQNKQKIVMVNDYDSYLRNKLDGKDREDGGGGGTRDRKSTRALQQHKNFSAAIFYWHTVNSLNKLAWSQEMFWRRSSNTRRFMSLKPDKQGNSIIFAIIRLLIFFLILKEIQ